VDQGWPAVCVKWCWRGFLVIQAVIPVLMLFLHSNLLACSVRLYLHRPVTRLPKSPTTSPLPSWSNVQRRGNAFSLMCCSLHSQPISFLNRFMPHQNCRAMDHYTVSTIGRCWYSKDGSGSANFILFEVAI